MNDDQTVLQTSKKANRFNPSVYEIRFSNGKIYVGKTSRNPRSRLAAHKRAARDGKSFPLHDELRIEPDPSFEVISIHATDEEALDAELCLIRTRTHEGVCLNVRRSTWGNKAWSDTLETCEKKRRGRLGKRHSEESKQLIREQQLANPSYGRLGKSCSTEQKLSTGTSLLDWQQMQSNYRKGEKNPNWKGDDVSNRQKRQRAQWERDPAAYEAHKMKRRHKNQNFILRANLEPAPIDSWL